VSAYLLSKAHEVELFERNDYFGGHSHTVDVDGVAVDTGFIVYNEPAYPRFSKLLAELGVATQPSDMSFSVTCHACDLAYSSRGLRGMLARPRGMLRPRGVRLAIDIARFYRDAPRSMDDGSLADATLDEYLAAKRFSGEFQRHFIVPLAAAVWSMAPGEVGAFPAKYMLRFLYNHGLVGGGEGRWRWRTVTGGSRSYVQAIVSRLGCAASVSSGVRAVERDAEGVTVCLRDRSSRRFDAVVLACHADEALELMGDASTEEQEALGRFSYSSNRVVLHTDVSYLPRERAAWASWNYVTADCRRPDASLALTYHMNRLQALETRSPICISVNPQAPFSEDSAVQEMTYKHPRYTFETLEGQRRVAAINGERRTFFAGAHLAHGFHEDGVESAYRVAAMLGVVS
jgi:predicted NAD/FAD-binding protein